MAVCCSCCCCYWIFSYLLYSATSTRCFSLSLSRPQCSIFIVYRESSVGLSTINLFHNFSLPHTNELRSVLSFGVTRNMDVSSRDEMHTDTHSVAHQPVSAHWWMWLHSHVDYFIIIDYTLTFFFSYFPRSLEWNSNWFLFFFFSLVPIDLLCAVRKSLFLFIFTFTTKYLRRVFSPFAHSFIRSKKKWKTKRTEEKKKIEFDANEEH